MVACAIVAVAACAPPDDGAAAGTASKLSAAPNGVSTPPPLQKHVLLIDLDGATYGAVQTGIANGTLPNLAKLEVQIAYSGGVVGALSEQPSFDTPGWATLLTGAWADRHGIYSDAPSQAIQGSTVLDLAKAASPALAGAVVGSSGLAGLLEPLYNASVLDTLTDCSPEATADDC
ncbi:MAG: alkaline phosphatase family protein, partial [Polyangiaceae bacterium]|nr:alkaline phosphatase family protein [Polyangiaceae bacterium]